MKAFISEIFKDCSALSSKGQVADYIPALKNSSIDNLGITIIDTSGEIISYGHHDKKFTIQSISKVVSLLLALEDNGTEKFFSRIGKEASGDPFNSIIKLETSTESKPLNPLINSGAITVTDMIHGNTVEEKFERLIEYFKLITGNEELKINEEVFLSEKETGNRNKAIAFFLKELGVIDSDPLKLLDIYFKQCSIEVTTKDLAKIALLLGNRGLDPISGKQIVNKKYCSICNAYMTICGMYDGSGEFAINIGIPGKSGVGGGILAPVPERYGIGVYGPSLNKKGNSIAGIKLLELLSEEFDFSMY
ncbi:MAG: glutaminase A [Firmicutes bacterium]|jgi:glutaminase|nr:glutaminase A [Bacillota bacterium]